MKIRNFEYFASRVARKFDTVIQRSVYNDNSVWFANGMYMNLDGEFLYISDYSNGVQTEVMSCFVYCYDTQKDFFHDLDIIVSCINTTAEETAETNGEDITENTEPEETEETVKDLMEVKQALNSRFGKEQCVDADDLQPNKTISAKIENINYCPNQNTCCVVSPYVHCDYNYKSDACIKAHKNFVHYCEQVHKYIKATNNPEWHHVKLATLANIDNDMLDEKHKLVLNIHQILKDGIRNLYKCENHITYEALERYVLRKCDELIRHNHLKPFWFSYIAQQLDVVRRNTIYLYAPYITAHREKEGKL